MRVRVRYRKLGKIRWIGHRDLARVWERTLRKAGVRVAWSEGFSPHPKLSFGLALSNGHESLAEYLDIELAEVGPIDLDEFATRLSSALPVGLDVDRVIVLEAGSPSLQQDVTCCRWEITLAGVSEVEVAAALDAAMSAGALTLARRRKGQDSVDDIRPSIRHAQVIERIDARPAVVVEAELLTQPRSLRPAEFISAVWPGADEYQVLRTHQWIERDGARWEPLPAEATDATHAVERAS